MAARQRTDVADFFRNFNAGYDTMDRIGQDITKGRAARANEEGVRQSTQTTSNYGTMDPDAVYTGPGSDGAMTNAESASYGLNVPVEDKAAGTGTTRQYGLGKDPQQWQDKEFTPEQKRVGGLQAQMAVYDRAGDTDRSDKIRTQVDAAESRNMERERFGLEKKRMERDDRAGALKESDDKAERDAEAHSATWLKGRAVGTDGVQRQLTSEDYMGALQQKAQKLFESGHTNAAGAAMKDYSNQVVTQISLQTAQRDKALGEASVAFHQTGDPNALKNFYNTFVPDGAQVTNISKDAKGNVTIQREDLDGRKLKPTVMQMGEFSAGLEMFKDPSALYKWSQNEFKNRLEERKVRATETSAGAAATNAKTNREYKDGMLKLNGEKAATKGTGRPRVSIQKNEDGSFLALNQETGEPVYNMDSNGRKLPIGMSATQFVSLQATAKKAGVRMVEGYNEDGSFAYGYEGTDGNMYSDPAEAAGAGSATKPADKKPGLPPPVGGLKPPGAPAANNRPKDFYADPARAGLKTTQAQADAARLAEIADDEAYAKRLQQMRAEGKIKTNPATLLARPQ